MDDFIQDIKDIKKDIVTIRIDLERGKTGARVAWIVGTFFMGFAGYFIQDYMKTAIARDISMLQTIDNIQKQVSALDSRVSVLEATKK